MKCGSAPSAGGTTHRRSNGAAPACERSAVRSMASMPRASSGALRGVAVREVTADDVAGASGERPAAGGTSRAGCGLASTAAWVELLDAEELEGATALASRRLLGAARTTSKAGAGHALA
ncbi:hypothetical protein BC834DRAFT_1040529 [Gloeopeniophorella convolvens]|nr:hypothetical protein BC834DRAFT_1040529 [Gloeopeniophorella convolvens]